jgi:hypothetical protein
MFRIMLGFLRYDDRDAARTEYVQYLDYCYETPGLAHRARISLELDMNGGDDDTERWLEVWDGNGNRQTLPDPNWVPVQSLPDEEYPF